MKKANTSTLSQSKIKKAFAMLGLLALGTSFESNAQVAVAIGAKGGLAINSLRANEATIESSTSGLGGLFLNFQLHPALAIQPEALITQRGASYTKNGVRTNVKLNYFEVPVLLKLRLPIGDAFFPHLLVGPNIAFNTKASYTSVEGQDGVSVSTATSNANKTNIGGLIGAGFDIQANHLFFTLDGRYGYSFNEVGTNYYNVKNVGWTISAGIGFRFGGGSGL